MRMWSYQALQPPQWVARFQIRLQRGWQHLKPWQRIACLLLAVVVVLAAIIPTVNYIIASRQYALNDQIRSLVGSTSKNLAAKLTYDKEKASWMFNKGDIPVSQSLVGQSSVDIPTPNMLQSKVGGAGKDDTSLYSVEMPQDPSKGNTYYDTNTRLSFSMVPQFPLSSGKEMNGQLVYPANGGTKVIYTAKTNGMKEDIVLTKKTTDSLTFSYKLKLPKDLIAKIQDNGDLGIFSADPALYGSKALGDGQDTEKIKSARETAAKDHLLFAIPAPVIVQSGEKTTAAHAAYELHDDTIELVAKGLDSLTYPASIDPSVVVTSSTDFASGNSDGGIEYPAGQINTHALTGGSTATWQATSTATLTGRFGSGYVAYNGFAYVLGGMSNATTPITSVQYAPININGTVGAWTTTTPLPTARGYGMVATYNGYIYVYGGYTSGTSALNSVIYAKINTDGSLSSSWQTASSTMATAVCRAGGAIYNGYIYAIGGQTGTTTSGCDDGGTPTLVGTVQYAQILANGDVGTWTTSSNTFTARMSVGVAAYNGYLYMVGGTLNGGTTNLTNTMYAAINDDGSLRSWVTAATTLPLANYRAGLVAYNGYLYQIGGTSSSTTTLYAPLRSNGEIGRWSTTTALGTGRYAQAVYAYNGYIYFVGGRTTGNVTLTDTGYAKIDNPGPTQQYSTTSTITAASAGLETVAYGGYLYTIGGDAGGAALTTVSRSLLNTDNQGGTAAFSTTGNTALPVGLTYLSATAYDGYMYVVGGCTSAYVSCGTTTNNVATVYSSPINSTTGALGAWTAQTAIATARYGASLVAYNNYLYVMGGINGGTFLKDIQYHAIDETGVVTGAWTTSTKTLDVNRAYFGVTVYGGALYVAGGCTVGATTCTTALNSIIYANFATTGGDLSAAFTTNATTFTNARGGLRLGIANGYAYIYGGRNNTTYYNDVQYSAMAVDKSLGTWTSTASFTNARSDFGGILYNNFLYIIGGRNGSTYYNTTQFASVENGGPGSVNAWTSVTPFTNGRHLHGSVAYRGYLYVVGGYSGGTTPTRYSDVQFAAINADGTLGDWNTTTSLPAARQSHTLEVYNGYMYVLGGKDDAGNVASTLYAKIDADGTLGEWLNGTALPQTRSALSSFVSNGHIYILGGSSGFVYNTIYVAPLNTTNGSIGTWTLTTSFTTGRYYTGVITNGEYVYLMGGQDINGKYLDDVQYAKVNEDGTIGAWNPTTSFSMKRSGLSPVVYNGYLYIFGGFDGTTSYNTTEYAPINANGTIGNWQASQTFGAKRYGHRVVAYDGVIYLTGGYGTNGVFNNFVSYSRLNSIPRISHYSKLIDFGSIYSLSSITYSGTLFRGLDNVSYRTAGANGVLGSLKRARDLTGPTYCAVYGARYFYVLITLDNSQNIVYPDTFTAPNNVTDFTVNYVQSQAAPEARLRGGKTFLNESLTALDTCPVAT